MRIRTQILTCSLAAMVGLLVGCQDQPLAPGGDTPDVLFGKRAVIHHASLGGADICEALGLPTGCDANFSLVANQHADGSVKGQWQDTFAGGGEGIHVAIDCLNVVGNGAVIGGVITHGTAGGVDVSGQRALTAVVDNGTTSNDTPDQLSFSFFPTGSCGGLVPTNFELIPLTHGQVKVK